MGSHSTTKNNSEDESSSVLSGSGKHAVSLHLASAESSQSLKTDLINEMLAKMNLLKEDVQTLQSELQDRKEENQRLSEELDSLKSQVQNEYAVFHQNLQEERYRFEVCGRR